MQTDNNTGQTHPTDTLPIEQDDHATLPVTDPIEPRPYLLIRPAETPVDPGAATRAMGMIDALLRETTKAGLIAKLRRNTIHPVVEWLLVSDGRPDPTIRYLVGSNVFDLTEDLEGILRTCFPNSYEFAPVEWHPAYLHDFLPPPTDDPVHPSITPGMPYVAAVEYRGVANLAEDWQTPLTPFETFIGPADRNGPQSNLDARRVPLAGLLETICDAELPVCFQVLIVPEADWTSRADSYLYDLDSGIVSVGDKLWNTIAPMDREARQRYRPPPADQERIDGIASRDPRHTVAVSARAVVLTHEFPHRADAVARRLTPALSTLSGRFHEVVGRAFTDDELHRGSQPPGSKIFERLCGRATHIRTYHKVGDWLRRRPHESKGILADVRELPGFCILDGAGLTPKGQRAVAARPSERSGLALPPRPSLTGINHREWPSGCRSPTTGVRSAAPSTSRRPIKIDTSSPSVRRVRANPS